MVQDQMQEKQFDTITMKRKFKNCVKILRQLRANNCHNIIKEERGNLTAVAVDKKSGNHLKCILKKGHREKEEDCQVVAAIGVVKNCKNEVGSLLEVQFHSPGETDSTSKYSFEWETYYIYLWLLQ